MKEKYSRIYYPAALVVTFLISLAALSRNAPRTLSFDYLGLLVGILAILVTVLIGWQIVHYVQFQNKVENIIKEQVERLVSDAAPMNEAYSLLHLARLEAQHGWIIDAIEHSVDGVEKSLLCSKSHLREPVLSETLDCLLGILHRCQLDGQLRILEGRREHYLRVLGETGVPHTSPCITLLQSASEQPQVYDQYLEDMKKSDVQITFDEWRMSLNS